jgi:hypothetical protein
MEGRRELSDVLNWREICLEDFETRSSSFEVGQVSKSSKQISRQFKMSFNSLRPSIAQLRGQAIIL